MTRVLLIHQAFVAGDDAGGTRHAELGAGLVAGGDTVTVVASQISYLTGRPVDPTRRGLVYVQDRDGIRILRAYAPSVLHRGFVWRVWAFLVFMVTAVLAGLRAGPVDLVMGTSPPIFQALSAWLIARIRGVQFVLEIRDLWPAFAISMGVLRQPVLKGLSWALEGFLLRRADHLLVNSPAYEIYLRKRNVPATKITLIPNGVDTTRFDPSARADDLRRRLGAEDGTLVVYAGALGPANDLGTLLAAAARLRQRTDIRFALIGDGKERAALEAEAGELGLTNVIFTGPLPKRDVPEALAAADICVASLLPIPMFTTTYPNKVFDYMAAGRPTVLAIDGVIRDVLEAAEGGVFVPPGDADTMARTLVRLADDPAARARMGASARAHVSRHFDRADQADQFRCVVRDLTRKPSRRHE